MILLTGGSGLLGRHLAPLLDCIAPTHEQFDIMEPVIPPDVHMIVHAAAYTDVDGAQREPWKCSELNVEGTKNLIALGLPLVYISTEYVFDGGRGNYAEDDVPNPLNVYAASKFLGERAVLRSERTLVIRTLFKPRPFEHPKAVKDQIVSGDYVDVIAPLIAQAIKFFEAGKVSGILHVGTGRKSIYDLAVQSRPDVEAITLADISVRLPRDTSLNLGKWNSLIKN